MSTAVSVGRVFALSALFVVAACASEGETAHDDGGRHDAHTADPDAGATDATPPVDASGPVDAAEGIDGGEDPEPVFTELEPCPDTTADVDFERELFITDPYVVDSDRATTWSGNPSNTNWRDGPLHFARLMEDLRGRDGTQKRIDTYEPYEDKPYTLSEFIHRWMDEVSIDDRVNCDVVPGRPLIEEEIRAAWPKTEGGETDTYPTRVGGPGEGAVLVTRDRLDVTRPPFRLLAVVFRPDLADLEPPGGHRADNDIQRDPPQAGELRLIYGLVDPETGAPKNFTVAFEYALPAASEEDVTLWHERWRTTIGKATRGRAWLNAISKLVWEVTRNNGARNPTNSLFADHPCLGCGTPRPHDNNLHQIRTNDYRVLGDTQQFREFRIPLKGGGGGNRGGAPTHFYLQQTFAARFHLPGNGHPKLTAYLNHYCEHIAAEHHKVPQDFPLRDDDGVTNNCDPPETASSVQAGTLSSPMTADDWWRADFEGADRLRGCAGLSANDIRHRFSRNTCNGCHGYEMGSREDSAEQNFMVRPRAAGVASTLSPFLRRGTYEVRDPKSEALRQFTERHDRKRAYKKVLCNGFEQPDYPTTFPPL